MFSQKELIKTGFGMIRFLLGVELQNWQRVSLDKLSWPLKGSCFMLDYNKKENNKVLKISC